MFAPYRLAQYYSKLNTKSLIKVATEIAKDVTDEFWNLDENDEFKKAVQDRITDASSVLKFKISDYLKNNLYGIFLKNMKKKYISWKN